MIKWICSQSRVNEDGVKIQSELYNCNEFRFITYTGDCVGTKYEEGVVRANYFTILGKYKTEKRAEEIHAQIVSFLSGDEKVFIMPAK